MRITPTLLAIATATATLLPLTATTTQAQGRTAANWSDAEKATFLQGCQERATPPGVSANQIEAYCTCVLNRLVRNQVPVAEITDATQNHPRTPDRWSRGVRQSMVSCLPRR